MHKWGLVRVWEWEQSRRIQSRTFKGVAPHSLYLLLMSGIPTHLIRAASALGATQVEKQQMLFNGGKEEYFGGKREGKRVGD